MLGDALLALLHYLSIFAVVAVIVAELVLCKGVLDPATVRRLSGIDRVYPIAALLALATGFARVFLGPKGWWFYGANPFFWAKLGVFIAIGLLSIPPTIAFIRWRKSGVAPTAAETAGTRRYISWQTMLLPLLPVCAVLMARGIGA